MNLTIKQLSANSSTTIFNFDTRTSVQIHALHTACLRYIGIETTLKPFLHASKLRRSEGTPVADLRDGKIKIRTIAGVSARLASDFGAAVRPHVERTCG